nr:MAG TPA: hypothetical protein [Caudoviricetes sp.]
MRRTCATVKTGRTFEHPFSMVFGKYGGFVNLFSFKPDVRHGKNGAHV